MSGNRICVLIIDDERSIRQSLADFLEDFGFDVITAESAEEGLELLELHPVQATIVDIRLPKMDGNTFISKAHEKCPSLGFIIHTGSVSYKPNQDLEAIGIRSDHVFRKPLTDMNVVRKAIEQLINKGGGKCQLINRLQS